MNCAKPSTETLLLFGLRDQLYTVFSSSTSRWAIMKERVKISIKSPFTTRWVSRIECIVPSRFYFSDVLDAEEELQSYCIQKQDVKTDNDARSLINLILTWNFILAIVVWHCILFHVNKTSKLMQTCWILLDAVKSEIHVTQSFLQYY